MRFYPVDPHQCNSFETNAIPQHACCDTIHHSNLTWRNRFALIIRTIDVEMFVSVDVTPVTPHKEIQSPTPKPMTCSEPCSPYSGDLFEPYTTTMVERGGRANQGYMEWGNLLGETKENVFMNATRQL